MQSGDCLHTPVYIYTDHCHSREHSDHRDWDGKDLHQGVAAEQLWIPIKINYTILEVYLYKSYMPQVWDDRPHWHLPHILADSYNWECDLKQSTRHSDHKHLDKDPDIFD